LPHCLAVERDLLTPGFATEPTFPKLRGKLKFVAAMMGWFWIYTYVLQAGKQEKLAD